MASRNGFGCKTRKPYEVWFTKYQKGGEIVSQTTITAASSEYLLRSDVPCQYINGLVLNLFMYIIRIHYMYRCTHSLTAFHSQ